MIIGVSFTAIFAGDIPATYLRIPGTPASVAATLDGYVLAQRGRSSLVLLLDLLCSALGGLIGVLLLITLAPQLARLALRFSSFEYFWLGVLGLGLGALITQGKLVRAVAAATAGVLLGTVGWDEVGAAPRFAFGQPELLGGLGFIPAMIGLFGLAEVFRNLPSRRRLSATPSLAFRPPWREAWRTMAVKTRLILQSSLIGTLIGALPGAGADIAAWAAYGVAQRTSRRREEFGSGSLEGVIAPTSANNAAVGGAWIPALVFGIPGDAVTAIVLGALLMYGIQPGPRLFIERTHQLHLLFAIAILTQFLLIPAGYLGIKAFAAVMRLPRSVILAGVVVFSVVGAYALEQKWMHVVVMFAFGLLGLWLERHQTPVAPLILGMILEPILEQSLRQGLIKTGGDFTPFLTRPDCVVMITVLVLAALVSPLARLWQWRSRPPGGADSA
jgi:TctA family transporter